MGMPLSQLDMDFDDFNDFREGDLVRELLEECYRMLRSQYFLQLRQKLDGTSPPWQVSQSIKEANRHGQSPLWWVVEWVSGSGGIILIPHLLYA